MHCTYNHTYNIKIDVTVDMAFAVFMLSGRRERSRQKQFICLALNQKTGNGQ